MKRFFSSFLGSFAAIWVSVLMCFAMMFMFIIMIAGMSSGEVGLQKHSILYLDLSGEISDRERILSMQDILMNNTMEPQSFETIINALHYAADDDKIDGVYIYCGGSGMGLALREELQKAIKDFKKRSDGKWVYAYADAYAQGDYYVASAADKLYLNPVGAVDIRGLAIQTPYFKGALDKLGVEMQIVKVGTFKSAVEPFILTEPSEASQLQTHVFLDAMWKNVAGTIAENRNVTVSDVNGWADSLLMVAGAEVMLENKIVTDLKYQRQVEDILRKKTGIEKDEDLRFVLPKEYMQGRKNVNFAELSERAEDGGRHIAVLYAVGDIVDDGTDGIVGNLMVPQILDLADDENVAGLVLRVNSGGGSAFASEQIWEALEKFKKSGKPFYVSMADYAASGGYYISCGADKIYADRNTLTGSIGIFGMIPCAKGLLENHLGINMVTVQTNPSGDLGSMFTPLTPQQHEALQRHVEDGYDLFTGRVAAGRDLPIDSVRAIAEGRVWDGATAKEIGLVDCIGGLSTTIRDMAKNLKMKGTPYVSYPKMEMTPMQEIIAGAGALEARNMPDFTGVTGLNTLTPSEARQCLGLLQNMRTMNRVQARMPMMFVK